MMYPEKLSNYGENCFIGCLLFHDYFCQIQHLFMMMTHAATVLMNPVMMSTTLWCLLILSADCQCHRDTCQHVANISNLANGDMELPS